MFEWEDKDGQHIMKEAQRILIYGTFSYFKAWAREQLEFEPN